MFYNRQITGLIREREAVNRSIDTLRRNLKKGRTASTYKASKLINPQQQFSYHLFAKCLLQQIQSDLDINFFCVETFQAKVKECLELMRKCTSPQRGEIWLVLIELHRKTNLFLDEMQSKQLAEEILIYLSSLIRESEMRGEESWLDRNQHSQRSHRSLHSSGKTERKGCLRKLNLKLIDVLGVQRADMTLAYLIKKSTNKWFIEGLHARPELLRHVLASTSRVQRYIPKTEMKQYQLNLMAITSRLPDTTLAQQTKDHSVKLVNKIGAPENKQISSFRRASTNEKEIISRPKKLSIFSRSSLARYQKPRVSVVTSRPLERSKHGLKMEQELANENQASKESLPSEKEVVNIKQLAASSESINQAAADPQQFYVFIQKHKSFLAMIVDRNSEIHQEVSSSSNSQTDSQDCIEVQKNTIRVYNFAVTHYIFHSEHFQDVEALRVWLCANAFYLGTRLMRTATGTILSHSSHKNIISSYTPHPSRASHSSHTRARNSLLLRGFTREENTHWFEEYRYECRHKMSLGFLLKLLIEGSPNLPLISTCKQRYNVNLTEEYKVDSSSYYFNEEKIVKKECKASQSLKEERVVVEEFQLKPFCTSNPIITAQVLAGSLTNMKVSTESHQQKKLKRIKGASLIIKNQINEISQAEGRHQINYKNRISINNRMQVQSIESLGRRSGACSTIIEETDTKCNFSFTNSIYNLETLSRLNSSQNVANIRNTQIKTKGVKGQTTKFRQKGKKFIQTVKTSKGYKLQLKCDKSSYLNPQYSLLCGLYQRNPQCFTLRRVSRMDASDFNSMRGDKQLETKMSLRQTGQCGEGSASGVLVCSFLKHLLNGGVFVGHLVVTLKVFSESKNEQVFLEVYWRKRKKYYLFTFTAEQLEDLTGVDISDYHKSYCPQQKIKRDRNSPEGVFSDNIDHNSVHQVKLTKRNSQNSQRKLNLTASDARGRSDFTGSLSKRSLARVPLSTDRISSKARLNAPRSAHTLPGFTHRDLQSLQSEMKQRIKRQLGMKLRFRWFQHALWVSFKNQRSKRIEMVEGSEVLLKRVYRKQENKVAAIEWMLLKYQQKSFAQLCNYSIEGLNKMCIQQVYLRYDNSILKRRVKSIAVKDLCCDDLIEVVCRKPFEYIKLINLGRRLSVSFVEMEGIRHKQLLSGFVCRKDDQLARVRIKQDEVRVASLGGELLIAIPMRQLLVLFPFLEQITGKHQQQFIKRVISNPEFMSLLERAL